MKWAKDLFLSFPLETDWFLRLEGTYYTPQYFFFFSEKYIIMLGRNFEVQWRGEGVLTPSRQADL